MSSASSGSDDENNDQRSKRSKLSLKGKGVNLWKLRKGSDRDQAQGLLEHGGTQESEERKQRRSAGSSPEPSSRKEGPGGSPQSASGAGDVPFAMLSGGESPMSATSGSIGSPRRISHELVDIHHPLPASSPPAFIQLSSSPHGGGSPSSPQSPFDPRSGFVAGERTEADPHTRWNIWMARCRELFSYTTWIYYTSHAYREMKKRRCNYCLGMFSCFLVVTVAAVCYTLIARAPVVFLQQAEFTSGQMDLQLTPGSGLNAPFMNYTTVKSNLNLLPDEYQQHTSRTNLDAHIFPQRSCPQTTDPLEPDWKYIGPSDGSFYPTCTNMSSQCLEIMCPSGSSMQPDVVPFQIIDTDREREIGLGRMWPYERMKQGECIVTWDLATRFNLQIGDVIQVRLGTTFHSHVSTVIRNSISLGVQWSQRDGEPEMNGNTTMILDGLFRYGYYAYIPLTIKTITSRTYEKFITDTDAMVLVESEGFLEFLFKNIHPHLRKLTTLKDMVSVLPSNNPQQHNWQENLQYANMQVLPRPLIDYATVLYPDLLKDISAYATLIVFNLGGDRTGVYIDTNFDNIQNTLISWSSKIIYYLGFTQIDVALPILDEMGKIKLFSLYLGLILSIILTILFLLSMLLIYSLLMISIESRTFELGVHRMCGMSRWNLVKLLIIQALSFAIPAWIVGLIVSQIIVSIVSGKLEKSVEVPLSHLLTNQGITVATIMGLILPLLASVLPIRSALSKNLQDALDTRHSKTSGVEFSIERSVDRGVDMAWLSVGVGMTVLGGSIYYLVPLALLSFNLTLFFNIFFALLLGMLLGLILLSLNFQPLIERFIVFILLWWESRATTFIVLKNLVTHRVRNRKTSIMFALSLGFILFITMAFELELYTAKARTFKSNGAELVVASKFGGAASAIAPVHVAEIEATLSALVPNTVAEWSWLTPKLRANAEWDDTYISNLGHAYSNEVEIYGITSNFFETTLNEYLVADADTPSVSASSFSDQLYTVQGSQAAILGTSTKTQFGLTNTNGEETSFLYALQQRQSDLVSASLQFHRLRPLTFLDNCPRFGLGRFPTTRPQPTIVSLPTFMRLSNNVYQRIQDIPMTACLIKFAHGVSDRSKTDVVNRFEDWSKSHGTNVWDMRKVSGQLQQSNDVMGMIFSIATYIAMFLCLFSLVASMLTNIYEQSKEISVMRSVGLPKTSIIKIYTYESFVLVMSSSILGISIGFVMSATMVAQRILFTQLPVPFLFPWSILGYVFTGSLVCAIVSSMLPARELMKKSIASIMKSVL